MDKIITRILKKMDLLIIGLKTRSSWLKSFLRLQLLVIILLIIEIIFVETFHTHTLVGIPGLVVICSLLLRHIFLKIKKLVLRHIPDKYKKKYVRYFPTNLFRNAGIKVIIKSTVLDPTILTLSGLSLGIFGVAETWNQVNLQSGYKKCYDTPMHKTFGITPINKKLTEQVVRLTLPGESEKSPPRILADILLPERRNDVGGASLESVRECREKEAVDILLKKLRDSKDSQIETRGTDKLKLTASELRGVLKQVRFVFTKGLSEDD